MLAKRPIANAAWKEASQQPGFYGNYASEYHNRLKKMSWILPNWASPGTARAGVARVALRFTLSQAGVHTAIIGTTNPQNAKANIAAAEKGPLPENVIKKIQQSFDQADPQKGWTGQQ